MGDIVGIAAKLSILEQDVAGIDAAHHMAILVRYFDGTVVQRAAMQQRFAQYFAGGADGLTARGFRIGQVLTFGVGRETSFVLDVKIKLGHGVGFAGDFVLLTNRTKDRSGPIRAGRAGTLRVPRRPRYKRGSRWAPIV